MTVPQDDLKFAANHADESRSQVVIRPPRLGGDEMNLAEFPFALLSDRQPDEVESIQFSDTIRGKGGEPVERTWIVTGGDEFGLPVASDEQVYVALMEVTREQNYANRVIHITRYELVHRLGWPDKGGSYHRLKAALDRLLGVTITAKQAFWDKSRQSYVDVGFHIIDDYALYNEPSFQAGNIKQLDTGFYFGLRSAVSRRLFRYLDKKRLDGKSAFRIDLRKLGFEKLGMSRNYYPSHIKQELDRAHQELIAHGFLKGFEYYRPGRDVGERVKYWFPTTSSRISTRRHAVLLDQLTDIGITASVARRLLDQNADEIARQLEYLPYRDANDPPAMLVEAVRNQWAPPASYLKAQAEKEEARQQAEAERQRRQQRRRELDQREQTLAKCRRALDALSPTTRQQIEAQARRQLRQDNPALAAHPDTAAYEIVLLDYIATLLAEETKEY